MSSATCDPETRLRIDSLLETLSARVRRELIRYFEAHASRNAASLEAAVAHLDSCIQGSSASQLETSLHHTHLPHLERRGWVEYDARMGDIRYLGFEDAERLLSLVVDVFEE